MLKIGEKVVFKDNNFYYEEVKLDNVTYELYASSDIYSNNKTLKYHAGDLIGTYKTKDGKITISNLYLGSYYIVETATLDDYVLDKQKYYFDLEYIDQYTPIVKKTFTLKNYLKKGTLDFTKTDLTTGKVIPNVNIEIYTIDNKLVYSGITDNKGKIKIDNLFVGKFYIIETDTVKGYKLSDEKVYFEIKDNGDIVKANMTNEKIKSKLRLHKVDEYGNILKGVTFEIYDIDNNLIGTYETDAKGNVELELEYGSYYIKEVKTLDGYVLNNEIKYFDVINDGEVIDIQLVNDKIKSKLKLHKVDEHGNILKGVTFEIYDIDNNLIGTYETDEKGNIELELEYGSYYIKEIKTLDGYVLNEELIYFDVVEDNAIIEKELINENIIVEVPNTNLNKNYYKYIICILFIIVGIGLIIYNNKIKK